MLINHLYNRVENKYLKFVNINTLDAMHGKDMQHRRGREKVPL